MGYQVLYRTYRPSKFSEVVGQDYIIKTLLNAIKNNKVAHAYLFAGPRGTGKTSVAKLFAKTINCENFKDEACDECTSCKAYLENNHPDIIELDAASNNSVDNIRDIIEQVSYAPIIGKYKIYIIDEVHMLSSQAFNALLKTLEEPPAHVIFILATTDPQKVIPTILSRCQRYNFSKISSFEIKKRIIEILNKEKIKFDEKAVEQIARMAEGGMRDALSIVEQCLAYNPKELLLNDVEKIFGLVPTNELVTIYTKIHDNEVSETINKIRELYVKGMDLKKFTTDLLEIIKDSLIYSDKANEKLLNKLNTIEAQEILGKVSINNLLDDAKKLEEVLLKEKQNTNFVTFLELALIEMSEEKNSVSINKKTETKKEEKITEDVVEEKIEPEEILDQDKELLLSIMLNANKNLKINDQIIYNKLDLYLYEPDKRKFYQALIGTELFASNKDAIIICGNKSQVNNINSKTMNIELYKFLNEEFGIDKMVYGVDEELKNELIELYKQTPSEKRNKEVYIEKYKIEKNNKPEDKLKDLFGEKIIIEE